MGFGNNAPYKSTILQLLAKITTVLQKNSHLYTGTSDHLSTPLWCAHLSV